MTKPPTPAMAEVPQPELAAVLKWVHRSTAVWESADATLERLSKPVPKEPAAVEESGK